jgi:hypothetical protein
MVPLLKTNRSGLLYMTAIAVASAGYSYLEGTCTNPYQPLPTPTKPYLSIPLQAAGARGSAVERGAGTCC